MFEIRSEKKRKAQLRRNRIRVMKSHLGTLNGFSTAS